LQQPLGKWPGPPTQVWQSFYNPQTKWVVTSTNGLVPLFTAYNISAHDTMMMTHRLHWLQCKCHWMT
jgi:hypothetical protein